MKNKQTFLTTIETNKDLAYAKTLVKLVEETGLTVKQVSRYLNSENGSSLAHDINYIMFDKEGTYQDISLDDAIESLFNHYKDTDTDFTDLILQK